MLAPNNKRDMTYQTDEKHLTNLLEHFAGAVKLACYSSNTCLLFCEFTNYLLNSLTSIWVWKSSAGNKTLLGGNEKLPLCRFPTVGIVRKV